MSISLDQLAIGVSATISAVGGDPELRARIQAIGLRVGRRVAVIRRSRYGGPLQVRIGTSDLLIRPQQAALVELETLE
ncbi:MAG: ferrous iron transport protein A [Chromatiales bacterium]|nr:ferrous iron transport protein A [Gammaproteobacteria bacterium]MCP5352571.1 ferrous iron transport protein A [Chromatiales bacterium]